ncbi:MAG: hypothetical protein KKF41_10660 [Actinobacteria bacterium]|nr:hypothetical protein [Actinomycetota bacterium]MBU1942201.1 hypothetical protein [Actinomycetota bacterium]MBU2688034.1 hypothetical protein [Actinomycetota bacterium]
MVDTRRSRRVIRTLAALTPVCLLLLGLVASGLAAETPTITEDYRITVNSVGDGHVVDTVKYSKDDFKAIKDVQKDKRGFLTRRYMAEDLTGEVMDFNVDLEDKSNSVVITYDKPGLAYCTEGEFCLYGYADKPTEESGGKFVFEEQSNVNSEFTLFTDQEIKTTTTVLLPKEATNGRYDSGDKAIKYEMPPASTTYGFVSQNKLMLSAVFGVLAVLFAGMLAFVVTRKPVDVAAGTAAGPSAPSPPGTPAVEAPSAPAAQAAPSGPGVCKKCGGVLKPGKHFCTRCGTPV